MSTSEPEDQDQLPTRDKLSPLLDDKQRSMLLKTLNEQKCEIISTAVLLKFSITLPPEHVEWKRKPKCVACLVKDELKRQYFIKVFTLEGLFNFTKSTKMIWEQLLHGSALEYKEIKPLFHLIILDSDSEMIGLNFKNKDEAKEFASVIQRKLVQTVERSNSELHQSFRRNMELENPDDVPEDSEPEYEEFDQQIEAPETKNFNIFKNLKPSSNSSTPSTSNKKKIGKDDIGQVYDFAHIHHMAHNIEKGNYTYNYLDKNAKYNIFKTKKDIFSGKNLEKLLHEAGVTKLGEDDEEESKSIHSIETKSSSNDENLDKTVSSTSSSEDQQPKHKITSMETLEFNKIMSELKVLQRDSYYVKDYNQPDEPDDTEGLDRLDEKDEEEPNEKESLETEIMKEFLHKDSMKIHKHEDSGESEVVERRPNTQKKNVYAQIGADAMKAFNERKERSLRVTKKEVQESKQPSAHAPTLQVPPPRPAPRKSRVFQSDENLDFGAEESAMESIPENDGKIKESLI